MSTKTLLLNGVTGKITAGAGDNSFDVTDPTAFLCLRIEGLDYDDHVNLVRENYAADGWEPVTMNGRTVQLNRGNTSVIPIEIGKYSLESTLVKGTVTAYTEGV